MYTVTQAARSANVSTTSIRNWSKLFADYLSPSANPPAGTPREYTADDLSVFSTIAVLRSQLVTNEDIRAALDDGQRLEPLHTPPHEQPPAGRADDGPTVEAAAAAAATTAIDIYRDRVNQLEARADALADRLIEAERRAAVAEAAAATAPADRARADALAAQAAAVEARAAAAERELEILRELHAAADPGRKMSFWEWIQQRRR